MHQVHIDVINPQILEGRSQGRFDRFWVVKSIPKFASKKNFLPFDNAFRDFSSHTRADLSLIKINMGTIDVTVANVYCIFYSLSYFARFRLFSEYIIYSILKSPHMRDIQSHIQREKYFCHKFFILSKFPVRGLGSLLHCKISPLVFWASQDLVN